MNQIFTAPGCVGCITLKRQLTRKGISFHEHNVRDDPEALRMIQDLGYTQVPVTITSTGHHFQGPLAEEIQKLEIGAAQ